MRTITILALMLALTTVQAEEASWRELYYGGGFGSASVVGMTQSQSALQLFAGYPLRTPPQLASPYNHFAFELGYIDVSDVRHDSLWMGPVWRRTLSSEIDLLLRIGFEVGDDDGGIAALGVEHKIDRRQAVRLEYVERSHGSVLTINLRHRP